MATPKRVRKAKDGPSVWQVATFSDLTGLAAPDTPQHGDMGYTEDEGQWYIYDRHQSVWRNLVTTNTNLS